MDAQNPGACPRCGEDHDARVHVDPAALLDRADARGVVAMTAHDVAARLHPAALPAPVTSDATRLVDYLVDLAMQAHLLTSGAGDRAAAFEVLVRERLAQAATTIVLELDEARATRVGELTARQLGEWAAAHDVDNRPHLRCWRTEKGWHVSLSVMQPGALMVRTYEAVAPDLQDAWTMLMSALVRS